MYSRCLGAYAVLLCAAGCGGSFRIPATEVPNLDAGRVRTVDGEVLAAPSRWSAAAIPRDEGGGRWMVPPDGRLPAAAAFVPDEAVGDAEDDGWREGPVRFDSTSEMGLGPPGVAGLAPLERQRIAQARFAGEVLWVRDREGRLVELPVDGVEHVVVVDESDEQKSRRANGRALWMTGAILGGALVAVVAIVGVAAWASSGDIR